MKNPAVAIVAIVVIVIAVAIIGWQLMGKGGGGAVDASESQMICESCGNVFNYRAGGSGPQMIMPSLAVECPKCHKKTAYKAGKCVHCGQLFSIHAQMVKQKIGMDFSKLKCPKCGKPAFQ